MTEIYPRYCKNSLESKIVKAILMQYLVSIVKEIFVDEAKKIFVDCRILTTLVHCMVNIRLRSNPPDTTHLLLIAI